jgi:MEMO1 family protein
VRRAARFAGSWYPGSPAVLEQDLDAYLAAVGPVSGPGRLSGLVVPHAGYKYSGPVAAHAYALLRGQRDLRVVLVGPSHREAFEGVAVLRAGELETPLGSISIDTELADALLQDAIVRDHAAPHAQEHSLEMQLPFLRRLVPGVRVVPLLMGTQSRAEVEALAQALVRVGRDRDMLLVASSDLSHYHPAGVANELDRQVIAHVEGLDAEGLMTRLEGFRGHACGGGPMVAVISASRALGATQATALQYADSGDAGERDKSRVVGYLAAALWERP